MNCLKEYLIIVILLISFSIRGDESHQFRIIHKTCQQLEIEFCKGAYCPSEYSVIRKIQGLKYDIEKTVSPPLYDRIFFLKYLEILYKETKNLQSIKTALEDELKEAKKIKYFMDILEEKRAPSKRLYRYFCHIEKRDKKEHHAFNRLGIRAGYCAMTRYEDKSGHFGNAMGHAVAYLQNSQYIPEEKRVIFTGNPHHYVGLSTNMRLKDTAFDFTNFSKDTNPFFGDLQEIQSEDVTKENFVEKLSLSPELLKIYTDPLFVLSDPKILNKIQAGEGTAEKSAIYSFGTDHHIRYARGMTTCFEMRLNEQVAHSFIEKINAQVNTPFSYSFISHNCASTTYELFSYLGGLPKRHTLLNLDVPKKNLLKLKHFFINKNSDDLKDISPSYVPSKKIRDLVMNQNYIPWLSRANIKEYPFLYHEKNDFFVPNMTLISGEHILRDVTFLIIAQIFPYATKNIQYSIEKIIGKKEKRYRPVYWKYRYLYLKIKVDFILREEKNVKDLAFWKKIKSLLKDGSI